MLLVILCECLYLDWLKSKLKRKNQSLFVLIMGIRLLNKLITKKCNQYKSCIRTVKFSELTGKRLVIDINVYLYDFAAEDKLIERVMKLCSLVNHYDIKVVFIFDGKPPKGKLAELVRRRKVKNDIEEKYSILKEEYDEEMYKKNNIEKLEKMTDKLKEMKRSCVSLTWENFDDVKKIINAFGLNYIIADGEADPLCSELVKNGTAYACVSQDMDLFAYKTPIIMRNLDLDKEEVLVYNLNNILSKMFINYDNFLTMCLLINTDYLKINDNKTYKYKNLFYYYKVYLKYFNHMKFLRNSKINMKKTHNKKKYTFEDYLKDKRYFNIEEMNKIIEIKNMYKKKLKVDIRERDLSDKPIDVSLLCYYSVMSIVK